MSTSTLGPALVVKTLTAQCDGQCGGTFRVTTDVVHAAYAEVDDTEPGWIGGEVTALDYDADDRIIMVSCPSVGHRSENPCDGNASLAVDGVEWEPATTVEASCMTRMNRA